MKAEKIQLYQELQSCKEQEQDIKSRHMSEMRSMEEHIQNLEEKDTRISELLLQQDNYAKLVCGSSLLF